MINLDMTYFFNGSFNVSLQLVEKGGDIDLVTDFGETITSVKTGYGLMRVLQDLQDDKYA